MNSEFTLFSNVLTATNKARGLLYFIKRSVTRLTKIFVPLLSDLVRPHLEYTIQANCPYLKKDINHLKRIQRAATKWLKGLTYEVRLKALKLRLINDFGPDPQNTLQANRSGSNSFDQVLQKVRTKTVINKTASPNSKISLFILFSPQYGLVGQFVSKYIHTNLKLYANL